MKKPRCGTEPTWELFRSDVSILASHNQKSRLGGDKNNRTASSKTSPKVEEFWQRNIEDISPNVW